MTTYTIYVCTNEETLCDGYDLEAWQAEATKAAFDAALKLLESGDDPVEVEPASNYQEWHGGRHYKCGGRVGSVEKWGYSTGRICCHEREVPAAIEQLMDRADSAMQDALLAAEKKYATTK